MEPQPHNMGYSGQQNLRLNKYATDREKRPQRGKYNNFMDDS